MPAVRLSALGGSYPPHTAVAYVLARDKSRVSWQKTRVFSAGDLSLVAEDSNLVAEDSWPFTSLFIVLGEADKVWYMGAWGAPKTETYRKSSGPGLNREPQIVFYMEFSSGIQNKRDPFQNMKYNEI